MEFDHSKLAGRIKERYGSQAALAAEMGMAESAFSNRMNNRVHFDTDEMLDLCQRLGIEPDEVVLFFLTPKF
jgi:transcriptional regulator with XRE-family HTH domain